MIEKHFGDILKRLREEMGVSQEALSHSSGLDRTYISLLERGLRMPTIITLFKLAKALNTPASEIIQQIEKVDENCN